ncbi:glycosyltransferase family 4 protein [Ferruginibacter sp. SUN106]|uniref:glycosyltransferase family 4 protein n=1 Tax=Ferruginibacter sp. SUN106 TaxID=2978348 RepID=UPI003D36490C
MVIAVNTSFTTSHFSDSNFIFECFSRLAQQFPQHRFIYIADKGFDEKHLTSKNISTVIIGATAKNLLLLQYQLNYKIPAVLRRHKADVFVSAGGYCSLRTKVPQCIIVNELSFLHHPELYTKSWCRFYKNNTLQFLTKAKAIVTTSQFSKQQITDTYTIAGDKVGVAYYGVNENFKPVSWQEKEVIKATYAEGLEYFLYSGPIHPQQNLITLLKAFSFFKKRQKSNMQLIIASTAAVTDKELIKSLGSFKYRNEAKVIDQLPAATIAKITAAAYALVYPSVYESFAGAVTEAMQTDVPVITGNSAAIKEICGDAAVYINPKDFNDVADKMMLLFKDENKRNELIAKSSKQVELYNWAATAATIWQSVLKCTE